MKILISAAETSSDAHGAQLLRALRKISPEPIDAFGIGGPKLRAEGLRVVVDARELLAMGFSEVVGQLPRILRALKKVTAEAEVSRPALAVVIDYPDFHFRLARKLRTLGVPLIYFIPPKVWVWRKKRVRILHELFAKVLVIFPFEESIYRAEKMAVSYVGNPLVDELPLKLSRSEARAQLGIRSDARVLLVMPGSRKSELDAHFELFLDAAESASQAPLQILLPLPATVELAPFTARLQKWLAAHPGAPHSVKLSRGDAHVCMVAADVGLIKSGTSTLEAGVLGLPHLLVYKPTRLSGWIFRNLIRYRGPVGLVNLVAGEGPATRPPFLVREIVMKEVSVESLAQETRKLLEDESYREKMREGLRGLRAKVLLSQSPSETAAQEILKTWRETRA